jgi:hypothetical protein
VLDEHLFVRRHRCRPSRQPAVVPAYAAVLDLDDPARGEIDERRRDGVTRRVEAMGDEVRKRGLLRAEVRGFGPCGWTARRAQSPQDAEQREPRDDPGRDDGEERLVRNV